MSQLLSLAESARTLVQRQSCAVLSTLSDDGQTPYGSLIEYCPNAAGDVIMLMSRLAEHQHYIQVNPRASVLIAPAAHSDNALAQARVALLGTVSQLESEEAIREKYLERHPDAALYLSLGDFAFYRLQVERLRFIAGFGRMGWLTREDYASAQPDVLWAVADGAIAHMNDDHADSVLRYAQALGGAPWAQSATLLDLDRHGMSIDAVGAEQRETVRIGFEPPLASAAELRPRVVALADAARRDHTP